MSKKRDYKRIYYYEHINGTIHKKPAIAVETGGSPSEYFNSPFVKKWWCEVEEVENKRN